MIDGDTDVSTDEESPINVSLNAIDIDGDTVHQVIYLM